MQTTKQSCGEQAIWLMPSAEKELAAYACAVQELFGSEQAHRAVEDWLEELHRMSWPVEENVPNWRSLSIAAARRLAGRVNAPGIRGAADLVKRLYQGALAV